MARTIQQIEDQITTTIQSDPVINTNIDATSPSKTAEWSLWRYIVAVCINFLEQKFDIFKEELELIALRAVPGTAQWMQRQVLNFQYSATIPQVVILKDFYPTYDPVLPELRIIKRCSVKQQADRVVLVKVATVDSIGNLIPVPTVPFNSLKGYLSKIQFVGTKVTLLTKNADRVYLQLDIYYDGEYVESTVKTNVILAVENYLATLPFNDVFSNSSLEDAIQKVAGVKDVVLKNVVTRQDTVLITDPGTVKLVQNYLEVKKDYETSAGYMIREDTATYKLEDGTNITMILAI